MLYCLNKKTATNYSLTDDRLGKMRQFTFREKPVLKRFPLSYSQNCTQLFERVRHLGQAVLLDSGYPTCMRGRFDIISADPIAQLCYKDGQLSGTNLPFDANAMDDPFEALSQLQQHAKQQISSVSFADSNLPQAPFCGGL